MPRHPFVAVNLISDPIHGYVELTKRLTPAESGAADLPTEDVAEEDLLDTAWLQRLRRISQLQSARWVFPTAEHSRFTHGLGVMHEAGLWARSLYPSLRTALASIGEPAPTEGLVVETLRMAGLLHDVGHGPFAHFFDDQVLAAFDAPADARRATTKRLTHEDLSGRIIEDELGPLLRGLRRAPGDVAERDAFADGEAIDPAWVSFLISKPALADPSMPRWVRWLQPLLSGVFTVDNLDYVRRDAGHVGVPPDVVEVVDREDARQQGLQPADPARHRRIGQRRLGHEERDPGRVDRLRGGEGIAIRELAGRPPQPTEQRAQLVLDDPAGQVLVGQPLAVGPAGVGGCAVRGQDVVVEEVCERPVPDVVQQPRHPHRLDDEPLRWGRLAETDQRGPKAGVQRPCPQPGLVHDPETVREAGVLRGREDPPRALQLADPAQALEPCGVEEVLLGDVLVR